MPINLDLSGAEQLATSAHQAAVAVADLTPANRTAGDVVFGSVVIPKRTGALAASATVTADAVGVTLTAGGPTAPYVGFVNARKPFFSDAIAARRDDVIDTYLDALRAAVAHLKGK